MGDQFDRASSMRVLCRNARRCKQAAAWKDGPLDTYLKRCQSPDAAERPANRKI